MKVVRDVMTTEVIHLSPQNKIKTAIILMKGHNVGGLPVVEDDTVVGVLDYLDILGKDNDIAVENIMDREFVTIPPEMPVADAADLMAKIGSGRLLVLEGGSLVGIVTRSDLLPEVGKSFDPITGLPRADSMRDWGIAALRRGQEVTVIFIDLDQFGQFNKNYGHITGDRVLQHVAAVLQSSIEEDRDMLCRYAGDEFVIVTTRHRDEALALAQSLAEALRSSTNAELPEPVTGSIGVYGGKRTREREQVHYEATLDNLINLASKSCMLAKSRTTSVAVLNGDDNPPAAPAAQPQPLVETAQPVQEPAAGGEKRLRLQGLNLSWGTGSTATAEVELSNGVTVSKHSQSGVAIGRNATRLVADAAAAAVSEFLPSADHRVVAESVEIVQGASSEDIVLVTALVITPQSQTRVSGSSIVKQDEYRAAVSALLHAVNRQIATLL